ncbi:MAG: hypothetical protein JJE25_15050 [Bacteroidia bacterium]|nr:hypothetical protein [Bacteroidia bacterium]
MSQQIVPRGYGGLCLGISFPLNYFASADPANEKAGFANTGFRLCMPFAYLLEENIGIGGILFTQKNPVALKEVKTQLSLPSNTDLSSIPWSADGILAGIYFSFPLDTATGIFLDIKLMGGIITAQLPVLFVNAVYYSRGYYYTYVASTKSASVTSFAYAIDAGTRFRLSNKIALLINCNYFSSTPEFKDIPVSQPRKDTYRQPMSTLNVDAGLAYLLK